MSARLCAVCDDEPASITCKECRMYLCPQCDTDLHKPVKLAGHTRTPMTVVQKPGAPTTPTPVPPATPKPPPAAVAPSPKPAVTASPPALASSSSSSDETCELCEDNTATIRCAECDMEFCAKCDADMHKTRGTMGHVRVPKLPPVVKAASPTPVTAATPAPVVAQPIAATPPQPQPPPAQPEVPKIVITAPTPAPVAVAPSQPVAPLAAVATPVASSPTPASSTSQTAPTPAAAAPVATATPANPAAESKPTPSTPTPAATPTPASSSPATSPIVTKVEEAKEERTAPSQPQPQPQPPPSPAAVQASVTPASPSPVAATPPQQQLTPTPPTTAAPPRERPKSGHPATRTPHPPAASKPQRPATASSTRCSAPAAAASSSSSSTSHKSRLSSTAPKSLHDSLSPQRNVLSMLAGSRWEEPDLRQFKSFTPGTFGTGRRDGVPLKQKNLLYQKSAEDLGGGPAGQHHEGNPNDLPAWDRLSKPKVFVTSIISPLFDDNTNCTFHPVISQAIQPSNQFTERLESSLKSFREKREYAEKKAKSREELMKSNPGVFTFKPNINRTTEEKSAGSAAASSATPTSHPSSSSSHNTSSDFISRMSTDLAERSLKTQQLLESHRPLFHPQINEASRRYVNAHRMSNSSSSGAGGVMSSFLERVKEDLDARYDGAIQRRIEHNKIRAYPFQPNLYQHSHNGNNNQIHSPTAPFPVFLGRMEEDLNDRRQKYEARCVQLGIPTPEEVAAIVRVSMMRADTSRSGNSTSRRS